MKRTTFFQLVSLGAAGLTLPTLTPAVANKGGLSTNSDHIPAFPGAEGFGSYTKGGRGGKVLAVTNLKDYDPEKENPVQGSFRAACEAKGPRIVVFRVSGVIPLKTSLDIREPYITIAGQTAPGLGICLANYEFSVRADEVIVRYLRSRPTAAMRDSEGFRGSAVDSISVNNARNVIIDHCSASWSVDETLSVTHSDNVTIQWCMITESLNCSAHEKGCHGYGSLVRGRNGGRVTFHHNLYAHHSGRSPRPGGHIDYREDPDGWTFDFRNNVIYNWGGSRAGYNSDGHNQPNRISKFNFVGNYYLPGPDSRGSLAFQERCVTAKAFFEDNWMNGVRPDDPWSLVTFDEQYYTTDALVRSYKLGQPVPAAYVSTDDAETAFRKVMSSAGATLPLRDSVDDRIVRNVFARLSGTGDPGRIIDHEDDAGGWPQYPSVPAFADSDRDGMPDAWEERYGLNPRDPADAQKDMNNSGYSNIEEYLNGTNPLRQHL